MKKPNKKSAVWRIRELAENNETKNPHELHLRSRVSYPRVRRLWQSDTGSFNADELLSFAEMFGTDVNDLIFIPSAKKRKNEK